MFWGQVLARKINSCLSMRWWWLQATTCRRCWSSSGISSVSCTKVKVVKDRFVSFAVGRFLSPQCSNSQELSTLGHIWCVNYKCGLVCSGKLEDFSAPHAAILSGIEYIGIHMMLCGLVCSSKLEDFSAPNSKILLGINTLGFEWCVNYLVWISLQLEVGILLSPPCSDSLSNWVHSILYYYRLLYPKA